MRNAGINVCCGGIIGLGETNGDRASLLEVLSNMNPHPESVPINSLVAIEGTGLEDSQEIDSIEMIRMIATARILMPKSKIRLSAGREKLSKEAQIFQKKPKFYVFNVGQIQFFMEMSYSPLQIHLFNQTESFLKR